MVRDRQLYVDAFKEVIDEVIDEYGGDPRRVRELVKVVLTEALKVFKKVEYEEIKQYAATKLRELGIDLE